MEPEWYLAAAAVLLAAQGDLAVADAIAEKFRPDRALLEGTFGSEADVLRVIGVLGLDGQVATEDFCIVLAVVRFNAFRLPGGEGAVGLFDRASMIAHSCCPNAEFNFDAVGAIVVSALRNLETEEEVTISYISAFSLSQSTEMRRLKLEDRLFTCHCERCEWPLDLCRGFCCANSECHGVCFMPPTASCTEGGAVSASAPCSVCGAVLEGPQLEEVLEHEARYGFVVEYGSLAHSLMTAEGLALGAAVVFRQHWILAAIMQTLSFHYTAQGSAEAVTCRKCMDHFRATAFAPWPWLVHVGGAQ